ncbi:MAG: Ig-like domain-containing protein, partial [Persicimonas sp.]
AMDELTTDPSSATIEIGKSLDIETAVKDDQDDDIDWNIDWSSSKDSVASVSSNGRVTGHSVGSTSITARAVDETGEPIEDSNNDPIEESVNIDVEQKSVDSIHVWPSSASIEEEQSIELFAQLRSSDGTVLDSGSIEWSGDSNEVDIDTGSDDRSAEVTAKSLDDDSGITSTIDVEATDGDGNDITETIQLDIDPQSVARIDMDPMVATLSIDGSASDHTVDIDATPQNAQGDTLEGRDVSWSVTDGNNNVDLDDNQSPVVVEAKEPGEATIKATSGDATGRTYIDVENQPPEAEDDDDGNVVGENDSKVDIDVLANDDDPDGDNSELEITRIVVDPVGGDLSWSASSPTIEYDPKDFHGEDGFVYEVEDEWGATDTAWVSVDVDKINGPTAAATCSYDSNNERIDLDATDSELPDGRPVDITWTLDSKPSDSDRESDDIDNRYSIETSLDPDENGTYDFELELTDSDGNSDTAQCDADAEGL